MSILYISIALIYWFFFKLGSQQTNVPIKMHFFSNNLASVSNFAEKHCVKFLNFLGYSVYVPLTRWIFASVVLSCKHTPTHNYQLHLITALVFNIFHEENISIWFYIFGKSIWKMCMCSACFRRLNDHDLCVPSLVYC